MDPEKLVPISDPHFAAFAALNKLSPKIQNRNGRVNFLFPAQEELFGLVQRFYDNESVPINDFVSELKRIKSLMWAVKGEFSLLPCKTDPRNRKD
jgi:hypothetical protein